MWMMENAASSAIQALETLYLSPTRQLELARLYRIEEWVRRALDRMLNRQLTYITAVERQQLGFELYAIIAMAKESLERWYRSIAFQAPGLDFDEEMDMEWGGCSSHAVCKKVWQSYWWRHMARYILDPEPEDLFIDLEKIKDKLRAAEIEGLAPNCKNTALGKLTFTKRAQILDRATELAVGYIKDLL